MRATDLSELAAFDAVARHRSFRRAGEERGVTASAISHAVSNLEARIGLRLLNRTTRSVSLTDAGAMLLSRLSPAFGDIGSALDGLNQFRDTPFGKVRINAPNSIAPFVLGPVMGPLIAANPNLELEIIATDRLVDIVEEGFDAGIRLGESLRDGMTAVRIKPRLRFAVVGSPDYFRKHPIPGTPAELDGHICIQNLYPSGRRYPWEFKRDGQTIEFQPDRPDLDRRSRADGAGRARRCRPCLCLGKPGRARDRRRPAAALPGAMVRPGGLAPSLLPNPEVPFGRAASGHPGHASVRRCA